MECRICGAMLPDGAKFCSSCGGQVRTADENDAILDAAVAEGEKAFESELSACAQEEPEMPPRMSDEVIDGELIESEDQASREGRQKSHFERLAEIHRTVRKHAGDAVEFGKKVGDGTVRAVKKTKEISADVSQKVGTAVDKTKQISGEVAVTAKKVGKGVGHAVKKTKETMDELGQVGVIITQRALDVVRASLRAVEIVDEYLERRDSDYEVGKFLTGVGIPPYLEIEFSKRSSDLTSEERSMIGAIRAAGIPCSSVVQALKDLAPQAPEMCPEASDEMKQAEESEDIGASGAS